jgi:nicotinic acid mononucleotide adenylyltransferase
MSYNNEQKTAVKVKSVKRSSNKIKSAVITIGRWHPPHKGHEVLIQGTIDAADEIGADPFVWMSPLTKQSDDITPKQDKSNPLTVCSRFYYLDKMYPVREDGPDLIFLSDWNNIRAQTAKELGTGASPLASNILTRDKWKILPQNWKTMTSCQKMKYSRIKNQVLEGEKRSSIKTYIDRYRSTRYDGVGYDKFDFITDQYSQKRRLPSYQCLKYLKKKGYDEVVLLVGSDRFEAFKTYNQETGDDFFKKFKISCEGAARGPRGQGLLKGQASKKPMWSRCGLRLVRTTDNDFNNTLTMMEGLLETEVENEESKESKESKVSSSTSNKTFTPAEEVRRSGKYSGTITRNAALLGNVVEFVDAVKIGNMTDMDCLCMFNEIRSVGDEETVYPPYTKDRFMEILLKDRLGADIDDAINFAITGPAKRKELRRQRGYGRKTRKKKRKKNRKNTRKKRGGNRKTRRKMKGKKTRKKITRKRKKN